MLNYRSKQFFFLLTLTYVQFRYRNGRCFMDSRRRKVKKRKRTGWMTSVSRGTRGEVNSNWRDYITTRGPTLTDLISSPRPSNKSNSQGVINKASFDQEGTGWPSIRQGNQPFLRAVNKSASPCNPPPRNPSCLLVQDGRPLGLAVSRDLWGIYCPPLSIRSYPIPRWDFLEPLGRLNGWDRGTAFQHASSNSVCMCWVHSSFAVYKYTELV